MHDAAEWAREQFATLDLGDARREYRAMRMLTRAAQQPAGRLTDVFRTKAERQAAYDFVESRVSPSALVDALAMATVRAAGAPTFVYVAVDGTSLTLTDRTKKKDFGSIGARGIPTRGLKVIDALAIDQSGAPIGLLDLAFWSRSPRSLASRFVRRKRRRTETKHWVDVIERVQHRLAGTAVEPWFVIDREGDSGDILRAVAKEGASFTIRAAQDRRLWEGSSRHGSLRAHMKHRPVIGRRIVHVPAKAGRRARVAQLDVRVARVVLDLPYYASVSRDRTSLEVNVVWATERRPGRGVPPLDWMLLSNRLIARLDDANAILDSYCHRWRVEDFHRTWKRGHCFVEQTQLRRRDHVVRWATMLAAVAARVERLKHLARTQPDAPASIGFSPIELQALRILKVRAKARNEVIPEGMPSIATAVMWLADLGGYAGKPTGRPGSITIGRGLEDLLPFALGIEIGMEHAKSAKR